MRIVKDRPSGYGTQRTEDETEKVIDHASILLEVLPCVKYIIVINIWALCRRSNARHNRRVRLFHHEAGSQIFPQTCLCSRIFRRRTLPEFLSSVPCSTRIRDWDPL